MGKKPLLFWIFWVSLTCTTVFLIFSPSLVALEEDYRIKYTIWMRMHYRASNGSDVPIIPWNGTVKCEIDGTLYSSHGIFYSLDIENGAGTAPVILRALHYILAYIDINGSPIHVLNLSAITHSMDALIDNLSAIPFKPEPIYTVARSLKDVRFWELKLYKASSSSNEDLAGLLVRKYYEITGEESGIVNAYINVTSPLIIYTGHQLVLYVHKWTMAKLKIYYENLTVAKVHLEATPYHFETIKLKVIPPAVIAYSSISGRILLPASIIVLLIGLCLRETRKVVRRHLREIAAILGLILLVLSFTLRLGAHNICITYAGLYNLAVNGEPWPGHVEDDALILEEREGTLQASIEFYQVSDEVLYVHALLTLEADEEYEELYRTNHPWEYGAFTHIYIPGVSIPLKTGNATIRLRVKIPGIGGYYEREYRILTLSYSGGGVRINVKPAIVVGYRRPMFNEVNILLAVAGTGLVLISVRRLRGDIKSIK